MSIISPYFRGSIGNLVILLTPPIAIVFVHIKTEEYKRRESHKKLKIPLVRHVCNLHRNRGL